MKLKWIQILKKPCLLRELMNHMKQLPKPETVLRDDSPVPPSTDKCEVEPSVYYENQSDDPEEFGHDENVIESTKTDRHDIDYKMI